MRKISIILTIAIGLLIQACVKDKPETPDDPTPSAGGRRVYIACEGSLGNGNASLSLYKPEQDSIFNNVFAQRNNQDLGDIFQSMLADGDELFMAINNSDRITIVNKQDFALVGTINVRKPRYMLKVSETVMYVSTYNYPEISIVNPETRQVTGRIDVDYAGTEGMTMLNGKVYACNWDTACGYIYEIDPATQQITHRINIAGRAPQQVLSDKNGKLWVLAGNVYKQQVATLTCIDPATRSILKSFTFPAGADVMKPCWNPTRDTLYYLGVNYDGGTAYNGVYRISINATSLPSGSFIPAQALQYYWALGLDSATNQLYLGDPKGFIQKGNVSVYQTDGSKIRSFDVGLGPGYFLFDN